MNVSFLPGAQWQNSPPPEKLPASHVGYAHPVRVMPTPTSADGTVALSGILKELHGSADVLPERVKPKAEPTEEPETSPTPKRRRSGPRRRGR